MEPLIHRVDQHTADGMECLLAAAALAVSSATSAASSGQMQICVRVSLCCNVSLCSFDATLCCFDWCLGVETAIQSDRSAKRPDGHWLCMLCPATIRSHQSNRPYQAGRAHNACILRANRVNPPVIAPILRSKRPYDTLRSTQQRKRRDQLRTEVAAASERVGCPLEAIQPASSTSPAQLLHLPNEIEFALFHLSLFHPRNLSSPLRSYSLIPKQQQQLHLRRALTSLILFDM